MKYFFLILTLVGAMAQDIFVPFFDASSGTGNNLVPNAIAYYRMDEASGTAFDASSNGRNLTEHSTVGTDIGIVGTSRRFATTTLPVDYQYLSSASTAFHFGSTPFTITAWLVLVNWTVAVGDFTIASKGSFGGAAFSYWWAVDHGTPNDTLMFAFSNNGTYTYPTPAQELNITIPGGFGGGLWFAYIRWDGTTLKSALTYFGDAALAVETTKPFAGPFFNSTDPMCVGLNPGLPYATSFSLDEMGFYARELSLCELGKLFSAKGGSFTWDKFDSNPCAP